MKPLLLLLVLGLIARTLPLVAQATPDSLRAVLASKASNAQKTEACMDLAIYTAQTSLDSAVAYGHSAVQYAEAQPNLKLKGQAYNVLATAYYVSDNYKAALANYLTSLSLCQKAEDCRGESRAYHNIGNIYLGLGSFAEAAEYYQKATQLHANTIEEHQVLVQPYGALATCLSELKQFSRALDCTRQALYHAQIVGDSALFAPAYKDLGTIYFDLGRPDSAVLFHRKALHFYKQSQNNRWAAYSLNLLSSDFQALSRPDTALKLALQALESMQKLGAHRHFVAIYLQAANLYQQMGKNAVCLQLLDKGLALCDSIGDYSSKIKLLFIQAKAFRSQGSLVKAYDILVTANALHDSLFNIESELHIKEVSEGMLLEKEVQAYEAHLHDIRVSNQKKTLAGIILFCLAVLACIAADTQYRQNKKLKVSEATVGKQKAKLEKLNWLKDQILGIIAHDLRSRLLKTEAMVLSLPRAETTKLLQHEVAMTSIIIDSLLVWSKLQLGKFKPLPQRLDPFQIAEEVRQEFLYEIEQKKLDFQNNVDQETTGNCDPHVIKVVLRNLVANAIRHAPENSPILLKSQLQNDIFYLSVTNTGDNMPTEKLTEVIVRASSGATASTNDRAGIGLELCLELLKFCDGSLEFSSSGSSETTFTIKIPHRCDGLIHGHSFG